MNYRLPSFFCSKLRSKFILAITVSMVVCFTACDTASDIPIINSQSKPDSDGVVRDIPADYKSEGSQQMKRKYESSLAIDDIQNGYTKLQIRILEGYGLYNTNRLFVIKNNGNSWKGELYYFSDSAFGNIYQGSNHVEKTELKMSDASWNKFVKTLFSMKIDKLRDYTQIPGFTLDTDEAGFFVEIAQDSFYKAYQIPTPSARKNEIEDAKYAVQITEFLDKNFGNRIKDSTYREQ